MGRRKASGRGVDRFGALLAVCEREWSAVRLGARVRHLLAGLRAVGAHVSFSCVLREPELAVVDVESDGLLFGFGQVALAAGALGEQLVALIGLHLLVDNRTRHRRRLERADAQLTSQLRRSSSCSCQWQ